MAQPTSQHQTACSHQQVKEIVRRLSVTRDSLEADPEQQQMYTGALRLIKQMLDHPEDCSGGEPKVKDVTRQLTKLQAWREINAAVYASMSEMVADVQAGNFTPCSDTASIWSDKAPVEQGWYWHWNGDAGSKPIPTSVLYSGTSRTCFVSMGQLGISAAIDCAEYGGFWLTMPEPPTPELPIRAPAQEFSL